MIRISIPKSESNLWILAVSAMLAMAQLGALSLVESPAESIIATFLLHLLNLPILYVAGLLGFRAGMAFGVSIAMAVFAWILLRAGNGDALSIRVASWYLGSYLLSGIGAGLLRDHLARLSAQNNRAQHSAQQNYSELMRNRDDLSRAYAQLRVRAREVFEWQDHLRRADKFSALGRLTAGLAHEIRNPLGSINGAAQILWDKVAVGENDHDLLEILFKETKRLNRVIENFLAFAQREEAPSSSSDLDRVAAEVLSVVGREAEDRRIQTSYTAAQPGFWVAMPTEQTRQALLNLVLNSIQAIQKNGFIRIQSRRLTGDKESRIELTIADSGGGIAADIAPMIFDPFFTTSRDRAGLGLSIVQRILMDCGGEIRLDREYRDGARFILEIPLALAPMEVS